jgi:hypothetical protein
VPKGRENPPPPRVDNDKLPLSSSSSFGGSVDSCSLSSSGGTTIPLEAPIDRSVNDGRGRLLRPCFFRAVATAVRAGDANVAAAADDDTRLGERATKSVAKQSAGCCWQESAHIIIITMTERTDHVLAVVGLLPASTGPRLLLATLFLLLQFMAILMIRSRCGDGGDGADDRRAISIG